MTDQIAFPPLHDLPPGEIDLRKQHLLSEIAREENEPSLRMPWTGVSARRLFHGQSLRRKTLLVLGAATAAAALAGGAFAAAETIWSGHDLTPADIAQQATLVANDKWSTCNASGSCTNQTGSHEQVNILPSMGVVFVLPGANGIPDYTLSLVPAAAGLETPPTGWGSMTQLLDSAGNTIGGTWTLQRADGSQYEVTWHAATGAVTEQINDAAGDSSTVQLHAGDVVPLIPGSTANDPRTLDKAVSFDLPTGNSVIIFPQLNETYIDGVNPPSDAEPLPYDSAAKYGLTPIGHYNGSLPVSANGGSWTVSLDGFTSTVSWKKGDSFVTVQDTSSTGTTTTQVPIGHELPLVPFK